MELATATPVPAPLNTYSYRSAMEAKEEAVWRNLSNITVAYAIEEWLLTLAPLTRRAYASGMRMLAAMGLIHPDATLQVFALMNHEAVIDQIKCREEWAECTRQAKAACYIALTTFLCRRTGGLISRAIPSREGTSMTFYRVREKVKTNAMTRPQWTAFLEALTDLNSRDCLIAKLLLQGGKRVSEVLALTTDRIDWSDGKITFVQAKTRGYLKETVITYPMSVMMELRAYIGERVGIVFITQSGRSVMLTQLAITFEKAGMRAGIPFKVTPHVLRASAVTYYKSQGFADADVMKVTGHASAEMLWAYDKSERSENASKRVSLV